MKRPPEHESSWDSGASKRRKRNKVTQDFPDSKSKLEPEDITTSRQLQSLLVDSPGTDELINGVKCFKNFLGRCSKSEEVPENDAGQNLKVLGEWLEAQSKRISDGGEGEGQGDAFMDILQVWSCASQKGNLSVLSAVVSSLALLVRICSHNEGLKAGGFILCKAVLQQSYLRIIYRTLGLNRDHVVAPCLRLLTEVNRFDHGSVCGFLYSVFDFTVKDITKNLEVRGGKAESTDDPRRPTVRTTFLRFILSFFQYGSSSVKNQVLGQRGWISPVFKYLRTDSPLTITEVLETLDKNVMGDREIPRSTKTTVFNEWVLGHIAELYRRQETVKTLKSGREEEKSISEIAHEFLMSVCTSHGNGICFTDSGWYPQGSTDNGGKRRGTGAPKVYNRTLASFISHIRPYADTLQQDLLLAIFRACPELVSSYFASSSTFSFDPKLTSTWIGYYAFLSSTIGLPIPKSFGLAELSSVPPPTSVIIENIVPKPLTKVVLAKSLSHENNCKLIKFFASRLLVVSFRKLKRVLFALDEASTSVVDPSVNWLRVRFDVVEEFCKRTPDVSAVIALLKSPEGKGGLQREAASRLLADYYETLSEITLTGSFDITMALRNLFTDEEGLGGHPRGERGLRFLEISHLLRVAKDVPDIKWWNKPGWSRPHSFGVSANNAEMSAFMPFSPFVLILKVCCGPAPSFPLQQIKILLHSFVAPSLLFQTETPASTLEALLESLSAITEKAVSEAVLQFLDESISRCIRTPFKYIDDYTELALGSFRTHNSKEDVAAVSPLVMTIAEQLKFFMESKWGHSPSVKRGVLSWLARFLESCAILQEDGYVLTALCDRLASLCGDDRASKDIFKLLKHDLENTEALELGGAAAPEARGNTGDAEWKSPRNIFSGLRKLDVRALEDALGFARDRGSEVSLFDIAIVQQAVVGVLVSRRLGEEDASGAILKLVDLLQTILLRMKLGGDEAWISAKAMVARDRRWVKAFLYIPPDIAMLPRYVSFSKGFSQLLCIAFDEFEPELGDFVRGLKISTKDLMRFLDQNIEGVCRQEVLSIYDPIIFQLLSLDIVSDLTGVVLGHESGKGLSELQCDILSLTLRRLSSKNERLLPLQLGGILTKIQSHLPDHETFCSSFGKYLLCLPEQETGSLDIEPSIMSPGTDSSPGKLELECALIRKVGIVRNFALSSLPGVLGSHRNPGDTCHYLVALLEVFSSPVGESGRFKWATTVGDDVRLRLDKAFCEFQDALYESPLDLVQIRVLQRAASLLPSLNREKALRRATRNKAGSLTSNTISLIGSLVDSRNATELRGWLLMVFDYLTRRFAEDELLSEEVLGFTKHLGRLLAHETIDLPVLVPRAALNAALEAGLQKHINTPQVVYFASIVVSQLPVKFLDAGKLLQMILGHGKNPLLSRDGRPDEISCNIAFIVCRLFSMTKLTQSTVTTLDGVLGLYRGSNGIIDTALLDIIWHIEAHLARSCATRIADWSITENAEGKPLISQVRGRLFVTIDGSKLARSILQFSPTKPAVSEFDIKTLGVFMAVAVNQREIASQTYDLEFVLPALTYCLLSENVIVDVQTAIERHTLGFAILGLCSNREGMTKKACSYIQTVIVKLEVSTYRERTQILHLLCALLASFTAEGESGDSMPRPLPTVMGVFLAQLVHVLSSPSHFFYEKAMELLLRQPLLDLFDVPHLLSLSDVGEEYHKEIGWILNVLVAGLKTEEDLNLYRRRNVFGDCINLYNSPYSGNKTREKIIELLWNVASIEGGGTTLITRNGIIGWVEGQLADGSLSHGNRVLMRRLGARLFESSAKEHIRDWSKGNMVYHMRNGIFVD